MKYYLNFIFLLLHPCIAPIFCQTRIDSASQLLEEVMVTAQYQPTNTKKVLYNVDVINEKQIKMRGATQLDQVLTTSPLLRMVQDPVLGSKLTFRGIDNKNIAILLDGVPVVGRLDGAIDLSQIPMQNVKQIEIVQGPLSNIYGNNAAGGVINIITKKSQLTTWNGAVESQVESAGFQNHQSMINFQKKNWRVGVNGRMFKYDQYPIDSLRIVEKKQLSDGTYQVTSKYPWNPKTQYGLGGNVMYRINNDHSINLKYNFFKEDVSDYDQIRRPTYKPYSNDNFYNTQRNDLVLFYNGSLKKHFLEYTLAQNLYDRVNFSKRYMHENSSYDTLNQNVDSTYIKNIYSRFNYAYKISNAFESMAGVTYNSELVKGDRIIDRANRDSTKASYYETAIYAELKYKFWNKTQIMVSGRNTFHSVYKSKFTPSFQLKYDLNQKVQFRASIAQGYRSPDIKELYIEFIDINHHLLGNPNLKPETSTDLQFNVKYSTEMLTLTGGAYKTNIKDKITLVLVEEPLDYRYKNFQTYSVYGFQGGLDLKLKTFTLSSSGNLGFWSTGVVATDVPAYGKVIDFNNQITYDVPLIKSTLMANHRYVGNQPNYVTDGDKVFISTVEAANYIDFSLNKTIFNKLNINVGVKNFTNVRNLNIAGTVGGIHQGNGVRPVSQGRSYFVNVGYSF